MAISTTAASPSVATATTTVVPPIRASVVLFVVIPVPASFNRRSSDRMPPAVEGGASRPNSDQLTTHRGAIDDGRIACGSKMTCSMTSTYSGSTVANHVLVTGLNKTGFAAIDPVTDNHRTCGHLRTTGCSRHLSLRGACLVGHSSGGLPPLQWRVPYGRRICGWTKTGTMRTKRTRRPGSEGQRRPWP